MQPLVVSPSCARRRGVSQPLRGAGAPRRELGLRAPCGPTRGRGAPGGCGSRAARAPGPRCCRSRWCLRRRGGAEATRRAVSSCTTTWQSSHARHAAACCRTQARSAAQRSAAQRRGEAVASAEGGCSGGREVTRRGTAVQARTVGALGEGDGAGHARRAGENNHSLAHVCGRCCGFGKRDGKRVVPLDVLVISARRPRAVKRRQPARRHTAPAAARARARPPAATPRAGPFLSSSSSSVSRTAARAGRRDVVFLPLQVHRHRRHRCAAPATRPAPAAR